MSEYVGDIPEKYRLLVGTTQKISGGVFSGKKDLPSTEYEVLAIRMGTGIVINTKELHETGKSSYEHPTYELLLKSGTMKAARWSRPFPIPEINMAGTEHSMFSND